MNNIIKLIEINPLTVGAPPRSKLAIDLNKNIYIVKNIKSRIIMKDGIKIVDIAKSIQAQKSTKKCSENGQRRYIRGYKTKSSAFAYSEINEV